MANVSRRNFLRGHFETRGPDVRPPWALAEAAFLQACSRCGDCVQACPESIIKKGAGGYPRVDFSKGGCTFCESCVESCRTGALRKPAGGETPWLLSALIAPNCLAHNRTVCRSCGEACEAQAIVFQALPRSVATPVVSAEKCTGCGGCVAVCPVRAIRMVAPLKIVGTIA
jgi:ferredoxin-type protein NapF